MRSFIPIHPPGDFDPRLTNILKNLNEYLSQSAAGFKSVERGLQPNQSQAPLTVVPDNSSLDHGVLAGLADDDHAQYLNLNGRVGSNQYATGTVTFTTANIGVVPLAVKRMTGQTAHMQDWKDDTGAVMSYIRPTDGAFIGPVVASGGPFLALPGVTGGQVVGVGAHSGGGTYDVVIEGKFLVGNNTGVLPIGTQSVRVSHLVTTHGSDILAGLQLDFDNSSSGAPGTGNLAAIIINIPSTFGVNYTSGSWSLAGINVVMGPTLAAGVSGVTIQGILFGLNLAGAGNFGTAVAGDFAVAGSATAHTGQSLIGIRASMNPRAGTISSLIGMQATGQAGTYSGATTQATAFDVGASFGNNASVVTWSGLRVSTGITAAIANKWALDLTNTSTNMGSRIAHPLAAGWNPATVAAITARFMLAAGASAAGKAPLKFQAGTNLATPEIGAVEFDGVDYFITGADRSRIAPRLLSRTAGIALNTVGGTVIYTVPAGRSLIVTGVVLYTTAYTGGGFSTFDVGGVGVGDIVAARNDPFSANNKYENLPVKADATVQPATTQIIFNITVGNRVATVTVDLIGYLI